MVHKEHTQLPQEQSAKKEEEYKALVLANEEHGSAIQNQKATLKPSQDFIRIEFIIKSLCYRNHSGINKII